MTYQKAASRFANANLSYIIVLLFLVSGFLFSKNSYAGDVDIVNVQMSCENRVCKFDVTLKHDDTGWDHYADFWRVVTADDVELGKRVLLHPHENEQPFTRSLNGVEIPININMLWIEAHDLVHGLSPVKYKVEL